MVRPAAARSAKAATDAGQGVSRTTRAWRAAVSGRLSAPAGASAWCL